jgi:hypothetical protein
LPRFAPDGQKDLRDVKKFFSQGPKVDGIFSPSGRCRMHHPAFFGGIASDVDLPRRQIAAGGGWNREQLQNFTQYLQTGDGSR